MIDILSNLIITIDITDKELVILRAALARYIESLYMSNYRILKAIGWRNASVDCDEKLHLIEIANSILKKIDDKILKK